MEYRKRLYELIVESQEKAMSGATRAVLRGRSLAKRSGNISGAAQQAAVHGEQPKASFISRLMAPFARIVQRRHLRQQVKGINTATRAYPLIPQTRSRDK